MSKKQKEIFWKLLVEKASVDSFGLQREKEKQGLYKYERDHNWKNVFTRLSSFNGILIWVYFFYSWALGGMQVLTVEKTKTRSRLFQQIVS